MVRSAHADWYLALAQEAEGRIGRPGAGEPGSNGSGRNSITCERDAWLLEAGQICAGLRITTQCGDSGMSAITLRRGSRWLIAFLAQGRETGEVTRDPSAWLDALFAASRLAIFRGHYREARALGEEMLAVAREHHDPYRIAAALTLLGLVALEQGDYPSARAHYEEGIPVAGRRTIS